MGDQGVGGRRCEDGPVGGTGGGLAHPVVGLQRKAGGAVLAVAFLVALLEDGELVEDVGHGVAGGGKEAAEVVGGLAGPGVGAPQVEVEETGVELGAEQRPAQWVVAERRTRVSQVAGERLKVPGDVGEFQHPGPDPVCQILPRRPRARMVERLGRMDRKLFHGEIRQARSPDLLPRAIVERQRIERRQK
ncbi:hypothetical protein A7Q09_05375 [Methylacidiphilum sp. Yel]|nr:hypothetical protein A7Q09_05375 [Methylacidiphilum sp. Yel]